MADEIRINTKVAEAALRQMNSVMQEWQQDQAGIKEALQGVMDGFIQDARAFLETFRQEDAEIAQNIRGDR